MDTTDVCIVGGGMAGASLAYFLAPHVRVVMLERETHLGYHSTGRSAALYAPLYGSRVIQLLTLAAGHFLRAPPEGFAAAPILAERGYLTIGTDAQRSGIAPALEAATAVGLNLELLSTAQARQLLPALRADRFDWALLDRTAMDIDVDLLLQAFVRAARARGARVLPSREVRSVQRDASRWLIRGSDVELAADVIVNAAGAWADEIAKHAGVPALHLVPYRRTAFVFDAPGGVDPARWPMVSDSEDQFYFKPEAGRLLGSLSEEAASVPCDAHAEDLDVALAVDRIEQVIDFPIQRVVRSWAGLRTFGPDRDPVSGFEPGVAGFYWHAGLGGYGIQTSAGAGAFAAAMILGRPLPSELADVGFDAGMVSVGRLRGPAPQRGAHG